MSLSDKGLIRSISGQESKVYFHNHVQEFIDKINEIEIKSFPCTNKIFVEGIQWTIREMKRLIKEESGDKFT